MSFVLVTALPLASLTLEAFFTIVDFAALVVPVTPDAAALETWPVLTISLEGAGALTLLPTVTVGWQGQYEQSSITICL